VAAPALTPVRVTTPPTVVIEATLKGVTLQLCKLVDVFESVVVAPAQSVDTPAIGCISADRDTLMVTCLASLGDAVQVTDPVT
jgi:hypothetical protein